MIRDYDIHGILGLRLVDPSPALARQTARQFDPLRPATLAVAPDVSISHMPSRPHSAHRFRLGDAGDGQESGFDDSEFALLKGGAAVRVPFDHVGEGCEISCTSDSGMRKLLIDYVRPCLQLSLLPKGYLAVHSAAVSVNGKGIVLAGWAESGKTEATLGLLQGGAAFVSDKWTIVAADGSSIHNFPTPITVRNWMIDLIPGLRARLAGSERLRARAGGVAASILGGSRTLGRLPLAGEMKGLADLAGRVSVTHGQLFGDARDGSAGWPALTSAPLDTLFLLMTSNDQQISVRQGDAREVAGRLADCALYERRAFFGLYRRFRYALPDRGNPLIEGARDMEAEMLAKALESKRVFIVEAPFPFDPLALQETLGPFC
jgi:hypothetical protein